jgi:hypothetical protein
VANEPEERDTQHHDRPADPDRAEPVSISAGVGLMSTCVAVAMPPRPCAGTFQLRGGEELARCWPSPD